ncbi:TetR/AcrR family transcriptional regulator [Hyphomicrobium sulfonivorans]|uniref:TetR/AcrR family transcriptional regulator n=1 Tax=Hyphomicrobium sulfonivorans TaxID=121290 RepID=UPI00156EECC2|nr:TetR/AcrR family transcriptional regulator [Hyphomicrobium sulfonivorans]MBI1651366.1 TetR/AcrR family transcriptional regulator [Hyphomicrobium sulfonivorans]NSL73311.1 TetR family transcriptional regulator [Hyphomicrobium sulfonivorans]
MRVSRAQAEENRQNVIDVASRLFREHGFDGIGLKDLMEGAGMTHGAFYKQFGSKEDLVAAASARAFESATSRWSAAAAANPKDALGAVIAFYLSKGHRKEKMEGCPLVALGADAARQSAEVKSSFESGIREHLRVLSRLLSKADSEETRTKAMAVLSTMVGAVTLARVVNDPRLAQSFLDAAAESVREIASS